MTTINTLDDFLDVTRARSRAAILGQATNSPATPVVIGARIDRSAQAEAERGDSTTVAYLQLEWRNPPRQESDDPAESP